ncbi:MAG: amidohydrolase family protein [Pseudomonadota bacterium]
MNRLLALLFLIAASADAATVFENVNVITMDAGVVLEERDVLVVEGRIAAISRELGQVAGDVVHIDGTGRWLMPGLTEMHAHVPPSGTRQDMEDVLTLFLAQGVTTIRGMLGEPGHLTVRDELAAGELFGPRLITSGPSFNGNSVTSPEQASERVRAQAGAGFDFLKVHPGLSRDEFTAIMAAAKTVDIPVAGHVSDDYDLWYAVEQGQDCIDHLDKFVAALVPPEADGSRPAGAFFGVDLARSADRSQIPALAERLAAAGTWIVPTEALMVHLLGDTPTDDLLAGPGMGYMSLATKSQWAGQRGSLPFSSEDRAAFLELRRELLRALHRADARLLLGSDGPQVFNVPGFSLHAELEIYVDAGIPPGAALASGTVGPATYFGAGDLRGRIAVGMEADLVLLRANPLEDISATREIDGVMAAGRWHDRKDLDARLAAIEARR